VWTVLLSRGFDRTSLVADISVAGASIEQVNAVRDLGVFIDSDLGAGAATHVRRTVSR